MSHVTSNWLNDADLARVIPLRAWRAAEKDAVLRRVHDCWAGWCAHWGADPARVSLEWKSDLEAEQDCRSGAAVAHGHWSLDPTPALQGELDVEPETSKGMAVLLLGVDVSARKSTAVLSKSLLQDAYRDLLKRLKGLLGPAHAAIGSDPQALLSSAWSGVLLVRCSFGAESAWNLQLSARAVTGLLDRGTRLPRGLEDQHRAGLSSLEDVLQTRQVEVHARLERVELTLGQLGELRVGDIVPLPHPLEQPVKVITAEGQAICEAWLGQSDGNVALELLPSKK